MCEYIDPKNDSISTLYFKKLREEKKFFDLCVCVDDKQIFLHKALICMKSKLINMLVEREQPNTAWPPVNTLKLTLPSNLTFDDLCNACAYIYDDKPNNCEQSKVNDIAALEYLCADVNIIISLIKQCFPLHVDLSHEQIGILTHLIETHGYQNDKIRPLISFYGNQLPVGTLSVPSASLIYQKENYYYTLIKFCDHESHKYGKQKFNKKLSEYTEPKAMKWIHGMINFKEPLNFEAFGVGWTINRFINYSTYGEDDDLTKLYVQENYDSNEKMNIRVFFVVFSEVHEPIVHVREKIDLVPSQFKCSYMSHHYKSNHLGFDMDYANIESNRIRLTLLIEMF